MGGFRKGGFSNNRFVKLDVAIASGVSILSTKSLAITDFHAKKTQHVQLFENPLPGTPPFAIPNSSKRGFQFCFFRNFLIPKGPLRTKNSTESKFTTATEKRYGKSKTLRIVL